MTVQLTLALPTGQIDLSRFVSFTPTTPGFGDRWQVLGLGRRGGQVGTLLGTISLKPRGGMTCVLQFEDGKVETVHPMDICPALDRAA